jgi:hypothetical protein
MGLQMRPWRAPAVAGLTLEEVRPHMGDFERKHYTNPTLMFAALGILANVGILESWEIRKPALDGWPRYGLARIQWEGPWTLPGVPLRARYRYTHWVGCQHGRRSTGIFDINCINNGSGWVSLEDWRAIIVPHLTALYPRANGRWHVTHSIEVERAKATAAA